MLQGWNKVILDHQGKYTFCKDYLPEYECTQLSLTCTLLSTQQLALFMHSHLVLFQRLLKQLLFLSLFISPDHPSPLEDLFLWYHV